MKKIDQLADYFKNSDNFQEALDQFYQVYLGACEICKGDKQLEGDCKLFLIDNLKDCL